MTLPGSAVNIHTQACKLLAAMPLNIAPILLMVAIGKACIVAEPQATEHRTA